MIEWFWPEPHCWLKSTSNPDTRISPNECKIGLHKHSYIPFTSSVSVSLKERKNKQWATLWQSGPHAPWSWTLEKRIYFVAHLFFHAAVFLVHRILRGSSKVREKEPFFSSLVWMSNKLSSFYARSRFPLLDTPVSRVGWFGAQNNVDP